jgi:branched-chain amino acid aminotransferase
MDRVLEAARPDLGGSAEFMVRILWTRGVADIGYDDDEQQHSTTVVIAKPLTEYPPETYALGISVAVVDVRRNPITSLDPRLKTSNLLNPRLAHRLARQAGADEALMLSQRDTVAEGSRTNMFFVRQGVVLTPSVETGILNGITRRLVLQLCRQEGLVCEATEVPSAMLQSCDEAFMTSTTMGVMPVTRLGARPLAVGPVTQCLVQAYNAFVAAGPWHLADALASTHP